MKKGDLILQRRYPGGICVLLDIIDVETPESKQKGWLEVDYPILKVHSPVEGIIQDPSYYYEIIEEEVEREIEVLALSLAE
jgi:hypothetical protein